MIEVDLLVKCELCDTVTKVSNIYIDDKTSEEEYLIKEYICDSCKHKTIKKEYIKYRLNKNIFE